MNRKPTLAVFGLGRMGGQIARRLHRNGFKVFAWNRSPGPVEKFKKFGGLASSDISEVVKRPDKPPRIFWIMLPQEIIDDFIFGREHLGPFLRKGDIVIDGGNSFYKDSMRRAAKLKRKGVFFFDCGTSGGVWGEKNGFAIMVGGPEEKWKIIEPIMKTLSGGDNYGYVGKAGAGHFTKMVHNGIEYGMMEAIAEGYAVLNASQFKPDLTLVTRIYREGSVVRSWLIDLCKNIFEKENIAGTSGLIDATGEGEWTVRTGKELGVDVRVIEDAFKVRLESKNLKNQKKFSNKIVALMRKQFGGHKVH
jgi:6-phosphogluconate dehydrogenase